MRFLRLALIVALAIPVASCCICVIPLGIFPIYYICDGWLEDGEDVVPVVGDLGGPVDEILSRTGAPPFPLGVGLAAGTTKFLATLNNSTRIFVTDETSAWGEIDLGRFFPSGGSIYSVLVSGGQVFLGTDQGIAWVNAKDGSWGHFSGAPTSFTVSLADNGAGGVLAGVYYGTSNGAPSVFLCDPMAHTCALSNSGMTTDQNGYPIGDFAMVSGTPATIFGGTLYGSGVFKSIDGGRNWMPARSGLPTSVSVRRLFSAGGNVFLASDATLSASSAGLYVSANLGGSWTKGPGLPSGSVLGIGGSASAVYAGVNAPNGQSAAVWTSRDLGSSWQATGSGLTAARINGVAVGNLGIYAMTNGGTFRSTDGGATWATFNRGKRNASVLSLLSANGALIAGTQGNLSGVQRTVDDGSTFAPGGPALANKTIASLAAVGNTIVATGTNGNFRSTDGGTTWTAGTAQAFGSVVASGGTFYAAIPLTGAAVYKSADGAAWTLANAGLPANAATALAASGSTLYAGVGPTVYASTNGGASWTAGGKVWAADTTYAISCLQVIDGVLYAGLTGFGAAPETYGFYKSHDGGATWIPIRFGLPANSYANAIAGFGSSLFAGMQFGLFQSTNGGASWTPFGRARNVSVNALAVSGNTLWVGTSGRSLQKYALPATLERLVPIVLDVVSGVAHYTTELALTNRGTSPAALTMTYTASLGSGSGTASESLAAGQQLVIPDAIAYFRTKGLSIPASGSQAGTLLVSFQGLSGFGVAAVTARTSTSTAAPQPVGRAGLAYSALGLEDHAPGSLTVYGLRSNATDRSNLAVFSMSSDPVTVAVTAYSGDGDGKSFVIASGDVLPAWGWKQYNGILGTAGMANGWVTVRQTSATGTFSAYGVINDNGTNDGSYVVPSFGDTGLAYVNVPVLVETPAFVSELTLSNSGPTAATVTLSYREALAPASGPGGTTTLALPSGTQRIIPNVLAFLRQSGVAVGPPGGGYAGPLHVEVSGAFVKDFYAGARTASPSPAGGQFGLFTPAFSGGSEALGQAYLYGLRADATNRSNVAVANTSGTTYGGSITLQLQAYDGEAGGAAKGSPVSITLAPGEWSQQSGFLGAQGVANGWVKVTRTAGTSPWIAYAVVNDGGAPGARTGDGAYIPMAR